MGITGWGIAAARAVARWWSAVARRRIARRRVTGRRVAAGRWIELVGRRWFVLVAGWRIAGRRIITRRIAAGRSALVRRRRIVEKRNAVRKL